MVLTTLTTRAYPLVRFRTGDRARLMSAPCPCGRTLRRLEWFAERTDDMVDGPGCQTSSPPYPFGAERELGFLPEQQRLLVVRRGFEDSLEIWLCVDDQVFSDEIKVMEQLVGDLREQLSQELKGPVNVRLKEKGSFA